MSNNKRPADFQEYSDAKRICLENVLYKPLSLVRSTHYYCYNCKKNMSAYNQTRCHYCLADLTLPQSHGVLLPENNSK